MVRLRLLILLIGVLVIVSIPLMAAPKLKVSTPEQHQLPAEITSKLKTLLTDTVADRSARGVSLIVLHRGEVIFRGAAGDLTVDSVARIASDTKPFSATAILTVVESGKLALDDTVTKFIPEFAGTPAEKATLRQLLSHTGGIPTSYPGGRPNSGSLGDLVRRVAQESRLQKPGEFNYSGVSIDVAARMAEVASGVPFEKLIQTALFEPLGFTHTTFTMAAPANTVTADAKKRGEGRYVSCGGGLSSTLEEHARFYQMLLNGGSYDGKMILKPETVAKMLVPQPNATNPRFARGAGSWGPDYGLGLYLTRIDAKGKPQTFHHGGALGTMGWADRDREIVGVLYTQMPLGRAKPIIVKAQELVRELIPVTKAPAK